MTILWSVAAGVCLTFALLHLSIWLRQRDRLEYLLFACAALAVAAFAYFEWSIVTCQSIEQCKVLLRWGHVPSFFMVVCIACFIRVHLGAGRWWLLALLVVLRTAVLVLNFMADVSLNYAAVHGLEHVEWMGGTFTVPVTSPNPMTHVGNLANFVLLVYVADAALITWRRGDHRKAVLVPGATLLFTLLIGIHIALLHQGLIQSPYLLTFGYLMILIASGLELSGDILRSGKLGQALQQRETELVESQQRMALAAEAAHLGMWVWDIPRDRFWSTDTGLALFGLPPDTEPSLAHLLESVHPEDRAAVHEAVNAALERGRDIQLEYRVTPGLGELRWLASRGLIEFDSHNRPMIMRGVSIDITERKVAELDAARSQSNLAHLSRVQMLGEMSSSIAHELNQPLTAILSNAEAAESLLDADPPEASELRETIGAIVEQGIRAGEVIRRLRSLMIKGEVQFRPLDINALVQELLSLMRNDMTTRRVDVSQDLAIELPAVCGDWVQLQQVFMNLLVNACEAMADTPVSERGLTIRTAADGTDGVRISVVDRGRGVPVNSRQDIFERFTTTKAGGMGLGLAISRTIVDAHGGRIWVEGDNSPGTCMCVVLPAMQGGTP